MTHRFLESPVEGDLKNCKLHLLTEVAGQSGR
jgi:hypothetical protein